MGIVEMGVGVGVGIGIWLGLGCGCGGCGWDKRDWDGNEKGGVVRYTRIGWHAAGGDWYWGWGDEVGKSSG